MNEQTFAAVESLRPFAARHDGDPTTVEGDLAALWDGATQGKLFLIVRDNFDEVDYAPIGQEADADASALDVNLPETLRTTPKPHQTDGIRWLATCAAIGRPGALLADDMGLGKTLQAIAFMAWLQGEARLGRREHAPFLIVAPTGLLGNWQGEIRKHLEEPGLGVVARAFGGDLKRLREESGLAGRDIDTGRASLDSGAWRNAGVVLTTYETVRDYHFSFARTRFGLIVYDEIQKLKNPTSQMSRAARALNSDFVLGMTGTPVENRLQDLWSIMDVMAPGLLGSSRDFERRHPPENREALAGLKAQLMDAVPPYMVRRLKSEALEGLPRKTIVPYQLDMPPVQAEAYKDVVIRAAAASASGALGKGGMLTYLAAMRGVSLHPRNPRDPIGDLADYAAESARVECAFKVLDEAKAKSEKVLVFVEDLAMQNRFAQLVQERYKLARRPMQINGGVPGLARQRMVDVFQSEPDRFDVMVLSPKAGGVGLTITAANHVIHLSRWWNPAVEDQATDRVFRIGQTKDVFVHVPMAVHPEGALRESSFDLRLNALIERKRTLTRDLFLPPDANDADLADLFDDVSLSRTVSAEAEPSIGARSDDVAAAPEATHPQRQEFQPAAPVPPTMDASAHELQTGPVEEAVARRPVLRLPKELQTTGARVWICGANEPRPTSEILALFHGRRITRATISDPYAIATPNARRAQIQFISDLAEVAKLGSAVIEYAPDIDLDFDDARARSDIGALFGQSPAASRGVTLTPKRRNKRGRHDDFHDRQVMLEIEHAGGAVKVHTLVIGRGVEALYDERWQCSASYAPPSS
nr:DEAD/DEAH box helicase [Caulobacter sp. SLTY]